MQHFIWRGASTIILAASLVFGAFASPAIVEAGSELLYTTARQQHASRNDVNTTLTVDHENGVVVGGYYFSGRPYLWLGLKGETGATAVVRIETPEMPQDMNAALMEQEEIACSFAPHGHGLDCS